MNKNKRGITAVTEIEESKTPVKKYKIKKSRKGLWFDESWQTAHRCIDTYHRIRLKLPIGNFEIFQRVKIFDSKSNIKGISEGQIHEFYKKLGFHINAKMTSELTTV